VALRGAPRWAVLGASLSTSQAPGVHVGVGILQFGPSEALREGFPAVVLLPTVSFPRGAAQLFEGPGSTPGASIFALSDPVWSSDDDCSISFGAWIDFWLSPFRAL
jgi:hypothetical protein